MTDSNWFTDRNLRNEVWPKRYGIRIGATILHTDKCGHKYAYEIVDIGPEMGMGFPGTDSFQTWLAVILRRVGKLRNYIVIWIEPEKLPEGWACGKTQ